MLRYSKRMPHGFLIYHFTWHTSSNMNGYVDLVIDMISWYFVYVLYT